MTARVLTVADAVAANILALWQASASPPGVDDDVQRVYEAPVGDADGELPYIGRQVYVFPSGYAWPEEATRAEAVNEYTVDVVVVERYLESTVPVPSSWLDVRVTFVEEIVWQPGRDPREAPLVTGALLWPDSGEVSTYDIDALREDKLFWSHARLLLREVI